MRLGELQNTLDAVDDLAILYVLPDVQVNEKTRRHVNERGLRPDVQFLVDPGSATIDRLGLRKPNPMAVEAGVPHPSTYVLDRSGTIRLVDVRENYHEWLDSKVLRDTLAELP